jgi:hypothetical protein
MGSVEVLLEAAPGLVLRCCINPVVAGFVDYGVCRIDNLLVREGYVAGLGVCLDVLDAAVESLDWLLGSHALPRRFAVAC